MTPALWTTVPTANCLATLAGRLFRRARVGEVDFDRVQRRVRPIRLAARQRHDLVAGVDHATADGGANAGAAAGDDGDRAFAHVSAHMKS